MRNIFEGKKLLVIGAGSAQANGIKRAKELGAHVIAVDGNPESPGFKFADKSYPIDFSRTGEVLEIAKEAKIDGAMTFSCDAALHSVAEIVEKLRLPGLDHRQVDSALNKYNLRKNCAKAGIPVPFFAPAESLEQCVRACAEAKYPCVVKPMDSSGSRGVTFVNKPDEIKAAYESAKLHTHTAVLVESFMPGLESSAEGFVLDDGVHIVTLSDKNRTPPPYLLDTDVIFPTKYSGRLLESIRQMATSVMECLKLNPTPFHMEMMITPDGPRLVEVGLRGPGFKVFSHIIPRVSGVDVLSANIAVSLGFRPEIKPSQICASAIKFIPGFEGTVKSIGGLENARSIEGVDEIEIYVRPGDRTHTLKSGADRIGHILVYSDTRENAVKIAEKAMETVKIAIE